MTSVPDFQHVRHKPPAALARQRELVLVFPALQSKVNLSRIVRAAACFGVRRIVTQGTVKLDRNITRDAAEYVELESHRTLQPVLKRLRDDGYALVGLEQTTASCCIYDFPFARRTALVVGHERRGLVPELLQLMDQIIEIPVHGMPSSHNAATAAAMAIYAYCRHFPQG